MDLGIGGRRAAVAAGSAGLGLGAARALAADGVAVAICGRDGDRVDAAVAELRDSGAHAAGMVVDLSSADAATTFVGDAADALGGPIDILVCNAGGPPAGAASSTPLDAYRSAFELNCLSAIAMSQAAVGPMREQRWGRIVAITSVGARQPIPYLAASSTARAAVTSFLKTLSDEVAADGVTVNSVQPGLHATERATALYGDGADLSAIPARRLGDPDDFGAVVAFLCSQQASFVTGAGLHVDGGANRSLQPPARRVRRRMRRCGPRRRSGRTATTAA